MTNGSQHEHPDARCPAEIEGVHCVLPAGHPGAHDPDPVALRRLTGPRGVA